MIAKRWIALILCSVMLIGILPIGAVAAAGLVSNIAQWDEATSVWNFTDAGLHGAGSNLSNAAFSSAATVEAGIPFVYEADMTLTGRSAALIFGYADRSQPTKGFAVNIDRTQKKMKFFKFTDSSFNKEYVLTAEQIEQKSYHISIEYDGSSGLKAYLDGVLRIETSGVTIPDGFVGVMAHYGAPTFNNIYLRKGDLALKNFEILTDGVTITPVFDPSVSIYGMDIAGGIDTVMLRPVKGEGVDKLYYTLKNREYKEVTKEKTEVADVITLTKEDFIDNYVNMDLTLAGKGFERTVTFRINKWFTAEELAAQEYRPQFHVTPQINYMNDPNGMVYDPTDGYWHLHYQYSPQISIGQQSWGHVRSKDLVNWEQMPVALQVDDLGRMYSGSAISLTEQEAADPDIYGGIFADNKAGESRLVVFYTNAGVDGKQRQCTAYSKDHGITWTKYNGGAAIIDNDQSISGVKFGDPKVFRIPEDKEHWYMVTCGLVQMFASSDLIHWEKVQALYYAGGETFEETPSGIIRSECPGMNPVTLEGTEEQKWIYNGCDGFYVVGDMVKDERTGYYNWIAESGRIDNESNFATLGGTSKGDTFGKYAGMTFYEDGTGKDRVIGISFIYDGTIPSDKIFKNYQSLPYEWKLTKNSKGEYVIINAPIEEIDQLRGNLLFSAENRTVKQNENILKDTTGIYFDLDAVIDVKDAERVGLRLRKGSDQEILISYSAADEKLTVDLSSLIYKRQSGIFSKSLEMKDGRVHLRVIVDQGVVEVFGNDGEAAITTNALTAMDNMGMELFAEGGTALAESIKIYDMKSMYNGNTYAQSFGTRFSIQAPESVALGETATVSWSSYPSGDMSKYYLECDAALCAVQTENGVQLKPVKAGLYDLVLKDAGGQTVATKSVGVGTFDTNIARWAGIGGIWSITAQGLHGIGNGASNAAYSSLEKVHAGTAFTFEADMALEGRSGALLFGYADSSQPTKGFAVNIDRTQKKMKLFKFTDSSFNKEYVLTAEQIAQKSYHLKIEYDGVSELKVYLDGVLRIQSADVGIPTGYVGVMAHFGDPTFNHVYLHTAGSDVSADSFETVEVEEQSDLGVLISKLPWKITVVQSDGIHRVEDVVWNTGDLSTDPAGEFILHGRVTNSPLTVSIKISVKHRWENKYTVDTPATCGAEGYESIHCALCTATKDGRAVAATGSHISGSLIRDVEPTCGTAGKGHTVCGDCGSTMEGGIVIPATGEHTAGDWMTVRDSTTSKAGLMEQRCKVCNTLLDSRIIAKKKPAVSFVDVKKSDFFYGAVTWAVGEGVTTGTSKTTFGPSESCTRAQAVTFLWRAAGCPAPKNSNNPFIDVKKSDYFYKAVLWAAASGVTSGTSKTEFSPAETCTRGQIVTFLWRAQSGKRVSASNPFTDVKKSDFCYNAVLWAVKNGVTTGTSATTFGPSNDCTRGQIVTFLYRAMVK